ncbi:hypothetical protein [Nannocystis pusilla]
MMAILCTRSSTARVMKSRSTISPRLAASLKLRSCWRLPCSA